MHPRAFRFCVAAVLAAASLLIGAGPAAAGPPFLSDDPEPTDRGHWEIYDFVSGGPSGLGGRGRLRHQLRRRQGPPADRQPAAGLRRCIRPASARPADRHGRSRSRRQVPLLHQADGAATPDVSVFPPRLRPHGYQLDPGAGLRNYWQGGAAVPRTVTPHFQLGAEGYAQGDDAADGGGYATINFGLAYKLVQHWSVLASAGPTWVSGGEHGQVFYVSLKADY